jgi:hypothetical protein
VYTKSNGDTVTLSASIKKTYALKTGWMPEPWHERLKTALLHDTVNIEGDKYAGGVKLEKMDEIDWLDFLDYPTAPVNGVVSVDPFFAVNANCQTCDEFTQVNLTDDNAGDVDEGETVDIDVTTNDDIFCQPATFSITSFNSDYLEDVSIDQDGNITFTVKEDVVAINNLAGIKYRVTCANGQYDEADVYMNILGTIEGCLAPTDLSSSFGETFPTINTVSWVAPDPVPGNGYKWFLYTAGNLVTPVDSGTSAGLSADITLPDQGVNYVVMVQSDCDGADLVSNLVSISFTSPVNESEVCGQYSVTYNDGTGNPLNRTEFTYINCSNGEVNYLIFNLTTVLICALQTEPGVPVMIIGATNSTYLGEC